MVWLYRSPTPVVRRGVISSFRWFLPAFAALKERGRGSASCDADLDPIDNADPGRSGPATAFCITYRTVFASSLKDARCSTRFFAKKLDFEGLSKNRVAVPGSGAFLTPGSGICFPGPGSRIPDIGSRNPGPQSIFESLGKNSFG